MNQLIIQGIGYLAVACVIASFQKQSRRGLLLVMFTGLLLFVIHYALLGAWVGSLMNIIEAMMVFVAYKKDTARWAQHPWWLYGFIGTFGVAGGLTARTAVDILPILGQIAGTIAVWQTSPRFIRRIMLIPRPLWFIYNMAVGSYAGMVAELCILLSVITGIVRFDIQHQKENR